MRVISVGNVIEANYRIVLNSLLQKLLFLLFPFSTDITDIKILGRCPAGPIFPHSSYPSLNTPPPPLPIS